MNLRDWLRCGAGLLAGASAAGLAAACCGGSGQPFWAIVMPLTAGCWLLSLLLAAALLPLSFVPALAPRLGGAGFWLAVGFGAGLVPVPNALGMPAPASYGLGAALAALIVLAAARWRLRVPASACAVFALLTPAWALPCAFYHNSTLLTRIVREADAQIELPGFYAPPEGAGAAAVPAPEGAPDVILVSIDTLRADALVGPRPEGYVLPFLDALRASGTWWDYALSSSNQTLPGHAGMLLGADAMGTTVRWNHDVPPDPEFGLLLAERFRAAGFRTAGVISNDLLSRSNGFNRGFELYDDTTVPRHSALNEPVAWQSRNSWLGILLDKRAVQEFFLRSQFFSAKIAPRSLGSAGQAGRGKVTSEHALAALEQLYRQERPFFLFLHYMDPHQPYGVPQGFPRALTQGLPPVPEAYRPSRKGQFAIQEIQRAASDLDSPDLAVRAAAELALTWMRLTYLERMMFLDDQIQRVHRRVSASGRPAVWLITSDHGEHFGEHGEVLHGETLYEEVLRVPFVLAGAGVPANGRAPGVPRLEDVAPTLLALAGVPPPEQLRGRALLREDAAGPEVPHVATDNERVAVRRDGRKALGTWRSRTEAVLEHWFDLGPDPSESRPRHAANLPVALGAALLEFLARDLYPLAYEKYGGTLSAGQTQQLKELGYTD